MSLAIGDEFLLVLRRTPDLKTHELRLVSDVDQAVAAWNWSTRVSPVFYCGPGEDAPAISEGKLRLFFCGPVAPASVPLDVPVFLTFGTFNVLLVARDASEESRVRSFLKEDNSLCWEGWELRDGKLVAAEFSGQSAGLSPPEKVQLKPARGLLAAIDENKCLLSAAITKARRYAPKVSEEIAHFRRAFSKKFNAEAGRGKHEMERLSWLVNVNAHLSRFTAQTYCGTSPITDTESHFWNHSLLGVGTATSALRSIKGFVELAVNEYDILDRLDALKGQTPIQQAPENGIYLDEYLSSSSIWERFMDVMAGATITTEARMPLIVCFSARDGFRSTPFSLSAPLELISFSNTYGWTPMTLTHELCHIVVFSALGKLFPDIDDPAHQAAINRQYDSVDKQAPTTAFEQLQRWVYDAIGFLHLERCGVTSWDGIESPHDWLPQQVLSAYSDQANELLTHIVDFQVFFNGDASLYINSVWSSWDTLPAIKDRLKEYVIRSACALLSGRLKEEGSIPNALGELRDELTKLSKDLPGGQYLKTALDMLDEKGMKDLHDALAARVQLVKFAYFFLCATDLRKLLQRERYVRGGAYSAFKVKRFEAGNVVSNPLGFIRRYSTDRKTNKGKSLWILQHLAFASYDVKSTS